MKPTLTELPGRLNLTWEEDVKIAISVSRCREHKDGRVTGEIQVASTAQEPPAHLHRAQFNFSSSAARAALAKSMKAQAPDVDWTEILEQLAFYTLEWLRQGEPTEEIWTTEEIQPPEYLLYPIMPSNQPTLIYGDGGVGKSLLALMFSLVIELPWHDNPFRLRTLERTTNVLYLDWETDRQETAWRLKCLQRGLGLPDIWINYRRCTLPLADDIEGIRKALSGSNVIVVDSVGAACGGDLNSAEVAIRFFGALRQLDVTSLLISHISKDQLSKKKTAYGCYSEDTEVLTQKGWKLHNEITDSDLICAYDTDARIPTLRWERPLYKWEYDYEGEMMHIQTPSTDILVTPNHRLLIKEGSRHMNFIPASDCPDRYSIQHAAPLRKRTSHRGRRHETFQLEKGSRHLSMAAWLKFLGYYLSEGGVNSSNNLIQLHQTKGPILDDMRDNLSKLGFAFSDKIAKRKEGRKEKHTLTLRVQCGEKECRRKCYQDRKWFTRSHHTLSKWLLANCGRDIYSKHIPDFVWKLDRGHLDILLRALLAGDGSHINGSNYRYYSSSKRLAGDVQQLAIILGHSTIAYQRMRPGSSHLSYEVGIGEQKQLHITPKHIHKEPYTGKVYCLTVPGGAYVTRRSGKTAIQGNSVYFKNFSRSVWEMRREQEVGEDEIKIGMFHRKANMSKLHDPLGFRISFEDGKTKVVSEDVKTIGAFIDQAPLKTRIEDLLLGEGKMTAKEISEELEVPLTIIRSTLTRMLRSGSVVKLGEHQWGCSEK